MADIRIKDLTTLESASLTGDVFVIDGTTGTRKLSAFSPTFGGNATVTGTLTVNSTFASTSSGTTLTSQFSNTLTGATNVLNLQLRRGDSANGFSRLMWNTGSTTEWSFGARAGDTNLYVWDEVANAERLKIASSTGNVSIASTTASTTTSSGALVVGNGTSGGLGVGGAINAGGAITSNNGSGSGLLGMRSSSGNASYVFWSETGVSDRGILGFNNGSSTLSYRSGASSFSTGTEVFSISSAGNTTVAGTLTVASNFSIASTGFYAGGGTPGAGRFLYSATAGTMLCGQAGSSYDLSLANSTGTTILGVPTGTVNVSIPSTSASTSTSSGALVVSGGVGVAGAIYAGGNITIDKAAPDFTLTRSVNTNSGLIQLTTSTTYDFAIGLRNTTDSDLHIYNYGTSNDALKIARSDSLATFGGAVRTAAPSGGTAANWKLGTVATVSPTSPNRTIEVDIGGTIYYIHAKTTNN